MQKSPVTEKDVIGIPEESYADARHLAHTDEKARWKKKAKKEKDVKMPLHKVGELVVCTERGWPSKKYYYLVEIVDFNDADRWEGFEYYGILRKTTNEKLGHRIGRFVMFNENTNSWHRELVVANVPKESIKWG